jgi:hypothetical protein
MWSAGFWGDVPAMSKEPSFAHWIETITAGAPVPKELQADSDFVGDAEAAAGVGDKIRRERFAKMSRAELIAQIKRGGDDRVAAVLVLQDRGDPRDLAVFRKHGIPNPPTAATRPASQPTTPLAPTGAYNSKEKYMPTQTDITPEEATEMAAAEWKSDLSCRAGYSGRDEFIAVRKRQILRGGAGAGVSVSRQGHIVAFIRDGGEVSGGETATASAADFNTSPMRGEFIEAAGGDEAKAKRAFLKYQAAAAAGRC